MQHHLSAIYIRFCLKIGSNLLKHLTVSLCLNSAVTISILPREVCCEVGCPVISVDDLEADTDERHSRFNMYCVKPESLNVLAVSLIFVCTTQTSEETSTAVHVYISIQRFKHSVSDVYGYNLPPGDAIPVCLIHVSQPVKHAIAVV